MLRVVLTAVPSMGTSVVLLLSSLMVTLVVFPTNAARVRSKFDEHAEDRDTPHMHTEYYSQVFRPALLQGSDHRIASTSMLETNVASNRGKASKLTMSPPGISNANASLLEVDSSATMCTVCKWAVRYIANECCEIKKGMVSCDPHSSSCEANVALRRMYAYAKKRFGKECFDSSRCVRYSDRFPLLRRVWADMTSLGTVLHTYQAQIAISSEDEAAEYVCQAAVTETYDCLGRPKIPSGRVNHQAHRDEVCQPKRGEILHSDDRWKTRSFCPRQIMTKNPLWNSKQQQQYNSRSGSSGDSIQSKATDSEDDQYQKKANKTLSKGSEELPEVAPTYTRLPSIDTQSLGFPEVEITWDPELGSWTNPNRGMSPTFVDEVLQDNQVFRQEDLSTALAGGVSTELIANELVVVLYQRGNGKKSGLPRGARWYIENIPGMAKKGLKAMYNPGANHLAAAKYLNWLQAVGWSVGVGYMASQGYWYAEDRSKKGDKILHYMQDYGVDLREVEMTPPCNKPMPADWTAPAAERHECLVAAVNFFTTYNHFFYRKLRAGKRKFLCYSSDKSVCEKVDPGLRKRKTMISPADSRVMVLPRMNPTSTSIWVKGETFTLENMVKLKSAKAYRYYENGVALIFRLAPQDYHRFHFPVDGTITDFQAYPGNHYSVNPIAITDDAHYFAGKGNLYHYNTSTPVFTTNKRMHVTINTEDFGCVLYISVGATNVASVIHTSHVGQEVVRGMEHGYMAYGGSTVIAVLRKGVIKLDKDLQMMSSIPVETIMRMGDNIGYRRPRPDPPVHGSENPCS